MTLNEGVRNPYASLLTKSKTKNAIKANVQKLVIYLQMRSSRNTDMTVSLYKKILLRASCPKTAPFFSMHTLHLFPFKLQKRNKHALDESIAALYLHRLIGEIQKCGKILIAIT